MKKINSAVENFCETCPRSCKINRSLAKGFCQENNKIRIAKIIKNFQWEEPCITGSKGSFAIFFSGCNLRCDYCQNYEISRGGIGEEYSIEEFCDLIEKNKATHSSIDLITPSHFSNQLHQAFAKISCKIPVVWNTNSYETVENIRLVSDFVDVFLADLKYCNNQIGKEFSSCSDYASCAIPAIKEMCKLKPDILDKDFMKQGVLIRHLVLPNLVENSLKVLNIIKSEFPNRKISIMSQFTPNGKSKLNRKLKPIEYKAVLSHLEKLGITDGYIQDFDSADETFVPKFT